MEMRPWSFIAYNCRFPLLYEVYSRSLGSLFGCLVRSYTVLFHSQSSNDIVFSGGQLFVIRMLWKCGKRAK